MVHLTSTPLSALGEWVSANERGVPPCWRAYFLLLRQKKVAKEKATPGAAPFGFLALLGRPGTPRVLPRAASHRSGRALPELTCGSDKASRHPPARLRCSAPSTGTRKASVFNRGHLNLNSHGQPEKKPKNKTLSLAKDASPGPLRGAEQRRGWRKRGEDCLRAQPEFRSPRQSRVAQGTGAAGTDPGSPFLCLLSFGEAKESETPLKGGTPSHSKPQASIPTPKTAPHGQPEKTAKIEIQSLATDASPGPLRGAEQRRNAGGLRRGLSEGRSPEFRSRPAFRVAQGTGAAGTDPGGAFSLATFFWRSKRKYARPQGGTPCPLAPPPATKGQSPKKSPPCLMP